MTSEPKDRAVTRGHVLVVDDERDLRALLRELFEDEGYMVGEASDGQVALDLLRATPNRWVVLTDHQMPRLDGPGLVESVLADPVLRARHAYLYMTATDRIITPGLAQQLEALQAITLIKPFSLATCVDLVAAAAARLADVPE
jgi:CheY-like chemotaxis protein